MFEGVLQIQGKTKPSCLVLWRRRKAQNMREDRHHSLALP